MEKRRDEGSTRRAFSVGWPTLQDLASSVAGRNAPDTTNKVGW